MLRYLTTQRLGVLQRFLISKRACVKVKSAWRSKGLYKEEASVVCRTVLISCTVLENTGGGGMCCNVTDSIPMVPWNLLVCGVLYWTKRHHRPAYEVFRVFPRLCSILVSGTCN